MVMTLVSNCVLIYRCRKTRNNSISSDSLVYCIAGSCLSLYSVIVTKALNTPGEISLFLLDQEPCDEEEGASIVMAEEIISFSLIYYNYDYDYYDHHCRHRHRHRFRHRFCGISNLVWRGLTWVTTLGSINVERPGDNYFQDFPPFQPKTVGEVFSRETSTALTNTSRDLKVHAMRRATFSSNVGRVAPIFQQTFVSM